MTESNSVYGSPEMMYRCKECGEIGDVKPEGIPGCGNKSCGSQHLTMYRKSREQWRSVLFAPRVDRGVIENDELIASAMLEEIDQVLLSVDAIQDAVARNFIRGFFSGMKIKYQVRKGG